MKLEQMQLTQIRVMRREAELAVDAERHAGNATRLAQLEAHLALAIETERQAVALMQKHGIPTGYDDE